jgi:hypothetical protein
MPQRTHRQAGAVCTYTNVHAGVQRRHGAPRTHPGVARCKHRQRNHTKLNEAHSCVVRYRTANVAGAEVKPRVALPVRGVWNGAFAATAVGCPLEHPTGRRCQLATVAHHARGAAGRALEGAPPYDHATLTHVLCHLGALEALQMLGVWLCSTRHHDVPHNAHHTPQPLATWSTGCPGPYACRRAQRCHDSPSQTSRGRKGSPHCQQGSVGGGGHGRWGHQRQHKGPQLVQVGDVPAPREQSPGDRPRHRTMHSATHAQSAGAQVQVHAYTAPGAGSPMPSSVGDDVVGRDVGGTGVVEGEGSRPHGSPPPSHNRVHYLPAAARGIEEEGWRRGGGGES